MPRKKSIPTTAPPSPEPAEVSPAVPEPEAKPSNTEPQTMEVHHHPEVEKKGIKEYLLEGLMIFLAVFMGFIAENIREDYSEHQKAKAYAITMANDLTEDTTNLKTYIAYYNLARRNVDTLMNLLSNNDIKDIPTGKLYLYGLWGGAQHFFISNDATFEQMKSTGSLQFFERKVAGEAAKYDQLCRGMQTLDESDKGIYVEVRKLRSLIFEFQYNTMSNNLWEKVSSRYDHNYKAADIAKIDSFIKTNPPLLTSDKSTFNQYVELVRSRYLDRKVIIADTVLIHATKLLGDIKKEYHTEE